MFRRLAESADVDYDQWLALVRTGLRLDLRKPSGPGRAGRPAERGPVAALILSLLVYLMSGVFFGVFALRLSDLLVSGTLVLSAIMFMVAASILLEFHSVVISPDDHAVLGHLPVSSRTYFAARVANLLFYVVVLASALGLPSIAAYCFTRGFQPMLGLAGAAAVYLAAVTVALAMVTLYAGLLHLTDPARIRRALSYVQIALSMAVYGSYLFLPQLLDRELLAGLNRARSPWLLASPSAWFACYLEIAAGECGAAQIVPAAATFAVLGALATLAFRHLSLDYSARLSALTVAAAPTAGAAARPRRAWFFRRGEGRAVALLIRNQFSHDMKFRLGVLSIVPLTVLYFLYGLRNGPMPDPFTGSAQDGSGWFMLHFAVLAFPLMLLPALGRSDAYRASWVFFATPASRPQLILSMKNFVMVFFVAPYLVLVGGLLTWSFGSVLHAALHAGVLALVGHITLQIAISRLPHLPFSRPLQKGERSSRLLGLFILASILAGILFPVLTHWVYRTVPRALGAIAVLAVLTAVLERRLSYTLDRLTSTLEAVG